MAHLRIGRAVGTGPDTDLAAEFEERSEQLEQPRQQVVLGGPQDGVVECDVGHRELARVTLGCFQDLERGRHGRQVVRCCPLCGQRRRLELDHPPQLQQFEEHILHHPYLAPGGKDLGREVVPVLVRSHPRLTALATLHQAKHGQMLDRLAQDGSTHPELDGQSILGR